MGLEIVQLGKTFGKKEALRDVSFATDLGVTAVLGPAGAGKSTLAAIVATMDSPSRGTVRVDGLDARKQQPEIRRRVGYAPQNAGLFGELTVRETLDYLALIQGMDHPPARKLRVGRAMERFALTNDADRQVGTLAPGLARRLVMAQACLGQPGLLVLDEPTAGIEPEHAVGIRAGIAELGRECAVLMLTSRIEDVAVAGMLAVLQTGRLRYFGPPQLLAAELEGKVWTLQLAPGQAGPSPATLFPTGIELNAAGARLRGVADQAPTSDATLTPPTLSDGYAWLLGKNDHETPASRVAAA
jgi:ABC-type multidrug transport system ATPase subunit